MIAHVNQKTLSYLEKVKGELYTLIIADHATGEQEAQEITENIWTLFRPKLVESFWNGVSAGNRGAKPKTKEARPHIKS